MTRKYVAVAALALCIAIPDLALAQTTTPPAQPAPAKSGTQIPEPGDFALFMIGVAGLVIGRWTSKARKRKQE